MTADALTLDALAEQEAEHRRQMANKEKRHAEEKQHLRDQLDEALRERDEVGRARALLGCSSNDSLMEGVRALLADLADARAEAERADEEATKLANSDLATTEQIIRALRVENKRLRVALRDIAAGDYSDPFCKRTPEQRARDALAARDAPTEK